MSFGLHRDSNGLARLFPIALPGLVALAQWSRGGVDRQAPAPPTADKNKAATIIDFNAGRKRLRGKRDSARCPRCKLYRHLCICDRLYGDTSA